MAAEAYVQLLGQPGVRVDGKLIDFLPNKRFQLLAYLAYQNDWVSRDKLAFLFWPDETDHAARHNLRQLLKYIRKMDWLTGLEAGEQRVRWQVETDVTLLKQALEGGKVSATLRLYQGPLLLSLEGDGEGEFGEWLTMEREGFHGRWREVLLSKAGELDSSQQYDVAAQLLHALIERDPLDELGLQTYMRSASKAGRREQSLAAYRTFVKRLKAELEMEPASATEQLAKEIENAPASPLPPRAAVVPAEPSPAPERSTASMIAAEVVPSLPKPATSFVGRDLELGQIAHLLSQEDCRLLTLTGVGGVGKTRLGLQVAAEVLENFHNGVFFVPLAAISDPSLLGSSIAGVLGVEEVGGEALVKTLGHALRDKDMLLVLDNFEQVSEAAPVVADLLEVTRGLKVLVTSRSALQLYGEHEYPVPSLSLPDPKRLPPLATLIQYETVRLFIERAQAVRPDFAVTNANAPAVAAICHRLDGLPLAIELAAARIKLLPPQAMLTRLETRLKLLTGGARNLDPRHQTLRSAIDWSYSLLKPREQTLFSRLAVFVGGCTLEASEAVCNAEGGLKADLLDGAESLLNKSLLRQDEVDGEPRFVMLETIHEYAGEKLQASGEAERIKRAHAEFFLALALEAERHLIGSEQAAWFERLETEHDNFRAALRWAEVSGKAEFGLRLANLLLYFWYVRGYLGEGYKWLLGILAQVGSASTVARADGLRNAGSLATAQGNDIAARSLIEQSLTISRELEDEKGIGSSLFVLAVLDGNRGNFALAQSRYEELLAIYQKRGDRNNMAGTLHNMGAVSEAQGNYALACSRYEQSIMISRELGDKRGIAETLINLSVVDYLQGNYAAVRQLLEESLALVHEIGDKSSTAFALEVFAALVAVEGKPDQTARLFGAAEALREAIGSPLKPPDRSRYEHDVETVRTLLDEMHFRSAWAEGRAMSLEEAVAYALAADSRSCHDAGVSLA